MLNTGKTDSDQFESDLKIRQERSAENYLQEFSSIVSDMLETSSFADDEAKLQKYIDAVIQYAHQSDINDVYSKSLLFNESEINEQNNDEIKKIVDAVSVLLETQLYKPIVERYISIDSLKALLKELIETYRIGVMENNYYKEVNNMIRMVKESLQLSNV